jgi:hypothetical protein
MAKMLNLSGLEGRKRKLRIFTVPELFAEIWRVYQAVFAKIVVPLLVVIIPTTLVNAVTQRWLQSQMSALNIDMSNPAAVQSLSQAQLAQFLGMIGGILAVILLIALVASFIQTIVIGSAVTYMTSEHYLGRSASFAQAFAAVRTRFMPLLGALVIYGLILIGLTLAFAVVHIFCGLGLGILAYIGIVAQALLTPVIVLERVPIRVGLRRAWSLAKRRFWAIVAVVIFTSVVSTFLGFVIGLVRSELVYTIGDIAISLLTAPIIPIAMTLIYYDVRVRYEDLESSLNAVPNPAATPADVPSPMPVGPMMDAPDYTNLAILTAAVFVLALILTAMQFVAGGRGAIPTG